MWNIRRELHLHYFFCVNNHLCIYVLHILNTSQLDAHIARSEGFEYTKRVSRIRKSNNTMTKRKRTNNDLQNIHIKLKVEYHKRH